MKKTFLLLQTGLFLITMHAFGQQAAKPVAAKLLVEAGVDFGGDEILQVFFTNGEDQKMRAGQGGIIAVGTELEFPGLKQLMVRASVGWKYNTTAANNANIRFSRFPVCITPFWKINEDFRLGVGITTHISPSLKGDGFLPDVAFTSTMGPRLEFGYKWFALTYTAINYKAETGKSVSASSIGATLSLTFPKKRTIVY